MSARLSALSFAGALLVTLCLCAPSSATDLPVVRVGSKSFTESFLLAEMLAQVIGDAGEARVERRFGLGGTGIVYGALEHGHIDLYPEYTGTLSEAILRDTAARSLDVIRVRLQSRGLTISDPLGFNNTYALAVRRDTAARLRLRSISDLTKHPELRAAFDSGFADRQDGWQGLRRHYGLSLRDVRVLEHALAYGAVAAGRVDVIDVFSTDGQLARHDLVILADDRRFFPDYSAVVLARREFVDRFPQSWARIERALVGRLDGRAMSELNAAVDVEGRPFADVASTFLGRETRDGRQRAIDVAELGWLTLDHFSLVSIALVAAVALGIPLAILASRQRRLGQIELVSVGVLQTIPALALLCFMIPLFGIGKVPALVALSLYALLPIVRGSYTGLVGLDRQLLEMSGVLGLTRWQQLVRIELPLASLSIMGGIKTAAVITVGTATLAAFIGGGGYGTLIVRGLALNDIPTILAGAVPSAAMAILLHGVFELLDRAVIPSGLRGARAAR